MANLQGYYVFLMDNSFVYIICNCWHRHAVWTSIQLCSWSLCYFQYSAIWWWSLNFFHSPQMKMQWLLTITEIRNSNWYSSLDMKLNSIEVRIEVMFHVLCMDKIEWFSTIEETVSPFNAKLSFLEHLTSNIAARKLGIICQISYINCLYCIGASCLRSHPINIVILFSYQEVTIPKFPFSIFVMVFVIQSVTQYPVWQHSTNFDFNKELPQ